MLIKVSFLPKSMKTFRNKENKEKNPILGAFLPRGDFPKNIGYVQLQRSPSIKLSKIQSRLAIKPKIIPSQSACKNYSMNTQFIKSFVRYISLRSPMIYKTSLIFHHAHPSFLKVPWHIWPHPFLTMPTH